MHNRHPLAQLPRDLPRTLRWSSAAPHGNLFLLHPTHAVNGAPPIARIARLTTGELHGSLGTTAVRIGFAGRRHPRLRLTIDEGREGQHLPDLAGFAPDWSGLGPLETGDGVRYTWTRGAWSTGGALIRDAAGAEVVRLQRTGDLDNPGALVDIYGTLPDGHAAALTLLGWAVLLQELSGPDQPLLLRGRRAELGDGEWM